MDDHLLEGEIKAFNGVDEEEEEPLETEELAQGLPSSLRGDADSRPE